MKSTSESGQWLGVELRHLAALDALAKEGSFRGAASRLGYVQSAVSQQIAYVEKVIGVRLVERNRGQKRIRLTAAGEILAKQAASILLQLDAAQADLATLGDPERRLRVAFAPSLGPALSLRMLEDLRLLRSPGSVERVDPHSESDLADLVEHGAADLAVGELCDRDRFPFRPLFEDPYLLLVPADSPLAATGQAELGDLRRLSLLAPLASQGFAHGERHLRAHDVRAVPTARAVSAATLQGLVRDRVGSAVLPRLAVDHADPDVAAIPLGELLLPRRPLAVYWQAQRRRVEAIGPASEVLRAAVREIA